MTAPAPLLAKEDLLRAKVNGAYSAAASRPDQKHPFPIGRQLAENLEYPSQVLDDVPQPSVEAFAGVSNVSLFADLQAGDTVLDLGCGAGMDSIIAARRVGPTGRVIGIDFSEAMLVRARAAKELVDLPHLQFQQGDAECLPLADESVDVALVNGIFNLNPKRKEIFSELVRVLRPQGRAYVAELILTTQLPEGDHASESNWFAWIAGAKEGGAFLREFLQAGFDQARFLRTLRNARSKNPAVMVAELLAQR